MTSIIIDKFVEFMDVTIGERVFGNLLNAFNDLTTTLIQNLTTHPIWKEIT